MSTTPPRPDVPVRLPDDLRAPPPAPDGAPRQPPTPRTPTPRTPPVTVGILVACVVVYLAQTVAAAQAPALMRALAPSATQIWHGAVWGLVTTAFVHQSLWHIAFNMQWARSLGMLLEEDMGAMRYLAFVVGAAAVSSGWQLATAGQTGIGYSGVVYALFGYAWARSRGNGRYAAFARRGQNVAWMLGWLVLCIVLTVTGVWRVGNAAHVSGLVFGVAIGVVVEPAPTRWLGRAGAPVGGVVLAVAIAGAVLACVWMPWSPVWREREAYAMLEDLRDRAAAGETAAESTYGGYLTRYPQTRAAGVDYLKKAADTGDVDAMNALAWTLATAPEDKLRDGALALTWAEKAVASKPHPAFVDTLAAAQAELGRWDEAVATEKKAAAALGVEDVALRQSIQEHLARLERREPIRE